MKSNSHFKTWNMNISLNSQRRCMVVAATLIQLIFIYSAHAQNVGIGLANPLYPLHVAGSIKTNNNLVVSGNGWVVDKFTIGNVMPNDEYKLRVIGGKTWTSVLTAGGEGFAGKIFSAYGDAQFSQNVLAQSLNLTSDGIVDGNFRINGRIGINGATNGSYGLYVNNANSYLQGNLNVANDAIVDGNTRVNGRVGINGATNGGYGLYVNNSHSYFQGNATVTGNTTVQGSTDLQGPVTIQGKGSVRSNGASSLRIDFKAYSFHYTVGGNDTKSVNVSVPAIDSDSDARVMIAQVISTGSNNDPENIPHFSWWISKVDASNNTCTITVKNNTIGSKLLSVHFHLAVIVKD